MSGFLFPDNTVLCNFAAVERLDLLKSVLNSRGRWVSAVEREARMSATKLPALRSLLHEGWLDEPIEIDPTEARSIDRVRRIVFGGSAARPRQHLGEAETCYVILHRPGFRESWWLSDDREAVRYARDQHITTRETIDVMSMAVVNGDISSRDGYVLMNQMADRDRYLRLPSSADDLRR